MGLIFFLLETLGCFLFFILGKLVYLPKIIIEDVMKPNWNGDGQVEMEMEIEMELMEMAVMAMVMVIEMEMAVIDAVVLGLYGHDYYYCTTIVKPRHGTLQRGHLIRIVLFGQLLSWRDITVV